MAERIDDLQTNGLKLIQNDELFCFGNDSVELANFVSGSKNDAAVDLGAGNGIITILLAGKKNIKTIAVELDEKSAALCQKNIELNELSDKAQVYNIAIQQAESVLGKNKFSIVVTNPPYYKKDSGAISKYAHARHEIYIDQPTLIECASNLLCSGGRFYIIYPCTRLAELLACCKQFFLEPKELCLLYTDKASKTNKILPQLFMLRCIKGGNTGLITECRKIKNY